MPPQPDPHYWQRFPPLPRQDRRQWVMGRRLLRQGLRRSRSSRNLHKNLHRRNIHQAEAEAEPKRKRKPKRKPNRQNLRRCLPRHSLHRQNLHRTLRRTDLRRQKPTTTRGRQLSWLERRPRLRRDPRSTREPAPLLLRKPPKAAGGATEHARTLQSRTLAGQGGLPRPPRASTRS